MIPKLSELKNQFIKMLWNIKLLFPSLDSTNTILDFMHISIKPSSLHAKTL